MPAKKITSDNRCERIIKAARAEQGLTQSALAKRLNITQGAVSRWERNIGTVPLDDLIMYCKLLKIDLDRIIEIKKRV